MAERTDWNGSLEELEARLWESADALRSNSKLTSNQYCMPVMGLIFLRYAWGRFRRVTEALARERSLSNGRTIPVEPEDYKARGVLWLPEAARYDRLAALPEGADLAEALNAAMAAIEETTPPLAGVLPKQYGELPADPTVRGLSAQDSTMCAGVARVPENKRCTLQSSCYQSRHRRELTLARLVIVALA